MRLVLLVVAAVIAVVAGITALRLTSPAPEVPAASTAAPQPRTSNVSTVNILVAREQIPVGAVITESMLDKQPWPSHLVLESFVVSDSQDVNVIGQVARTTFLPHEPLLKTRLGNPNDPSFLAAVLPAGMRAMTLATDAISGVAGYVFPGDRIDVLLTHNVPQELKALQNEKSKGPASGRPTVTEVLLSNVRVLAVNLREPPGKELVQSTTNPSSITIEVPETMAQQVRLAEKQGTLSLSLRSLKDRDEQRTPDPTMLEDLTRANIWQASNIRIVRGAGDDTDAMTAQPDESGGSETKAAISNP